MDIPDLDETILATTGDDTINGCRPRECGDRALVEREKPFKLAGGGGFGMSGQSDVTRFVTPQDTVTL